MAIAFWNFGATAWSLRLALPSLTPPRVPVSPAGPTPDIRGIVPAQAYFSPAINLFWVTVGVVSLLLAAWVFWYFFQRPRAQNPRGVLLSPREIALRRLRELEKQAGVLDPRLFGVEVSDVLRTYIGAQFGLQPARQTSPEFLAAIVHASVFSAAEKALLAEFLEQADLLKFARQAAPAEARRSLLAQAGEFLQPTAPAPPAREILSASA